MIGVAEWKKGKSSKEPRTVSICFSGDYQTSRNVWEAKRIILDHYLSSVGDTASMDDTAPNIHLFTEDDDYTCNLKQLLYPPFLRYKSFQDSEVSNAQEGEVSQSQANGAPVCHRQAQAPPRQATSKGLARRTKRTTAMVRSLGTHSVGITSALGYLNKKIVRRQPNARPKAENGSTCVEPKMYYYLCKQKARPTGFACVLLPLELFILESDTVPDFKKGQPTVEKYNLLPEQRTWFLARFIKSFPVLEAYRKTLATIVANMAYPCPGCQMNHDAIVHCVPPTYTRLPST